MLTRLSRPYRALALLAALVIIGVALQAHALSFFSFESESGALADQASSGNDAAASGGAYVKFGTTADTALSNFFPIGVDLAPSSSFATWKARGINTVIREQISATDAQVKSWSDAIEAAGLYQIRRPLANPADDIGRKSLLAWAAHKDESEATGTAQVTWETVQARYNSLKAITTTIPIEIAVQGAFNQHDNRADAVPWSGELWYQKYFAGADWLITHRYPVNGGGAWLCDINATLSCFNGMANRVQTWQEPANAKPWFAYLEASDYNTSDANPGPTGAQTKAQAWYCITQGARGIFYFPERVTPTFSFDATTADMQSTMIALSAQLKDLTPVIQGPVNPSGVSASTSDASLQLGWRVHSTGKYFIVVNMSNATLTNQVINLTGVSGTGTVYGESRTEPITSGAITDTFAPYAVHIYQF